MTDSITLVMFCFPAALAALFSIVTIVPKGQDDDKNGGFFSASLITLMASIVASICWSIFALIWPALATADYMIGIAYLWYALSAVFAVFAIAISVRMLAEIKDAKAPPKLTLRQGYFED